MTPFKVRFDGKHFESDQPCCKRWFVEFKPTRGIKGTFTPHSFSSEREAFAFMRNMNHAFNLGRDNA